MTSYESLDRDSEDGAGIRMYIGTYEGHRNEKYERHGFGHALLPNGDEYYVLNDAKSICVYRKLDKSRIIL